MNSLYAAYKTDPQKEKAGVEVEYGFRHDKPTKFLIARAGGANDRFARILDQKLKPYRRMVQSDTMDTALSERLLKEAYAEAIVLGWTNVGDENDKDLEFSVANVIKLFTDLPDLFIDIQQISRNLAIYRETVREDDAKN